MTTGTRHIRSLITTSRSVLESAGLKLQPSPESLADLADALTAIDHEEPTKASFIGAPAVFLLELACQQLNAAFPGQCYSVGSSLERADWRDVDVRMIMADEDFAVLFPNAAENSWEFDPRWLIMTTSISAWLSKMTGLPIDFQFQQRTHANARHKGVRNPLGLFIVKDEK